MNFVDVSWAKFPFTDNTGKGLNHRASSEFVVRMVVAATGTKCECLSNFRPIRSLNVS